MNKNLAAVLKLLAERSEISSDSGVMATGIAHS